MSINRYKIRGHLTQGCKFQCDSTATATRALVFVSPVTVCFLFFPPEHEVLSLNVTQPCVATSLWKFNITGTLNTVFFHGTFPIGPISQV